MRRPDVALPLPHSSGFPIPRLQEGHHDQPQRYRQEICPGDGRRGDHHRLRGCLAVLDRGAGRRCQATGPRRHTPRQTPRGLGQRRRDHGRPTGRRMPGPARRVRPRDPRQSCHHRAGVPAGRHHGHPGRRVGRNRVDGKTLQRASRQVAHPDRTGTWHFARSLRRRHRLADAGTPWPGPRLRRTDRGRDLPGLREPVRSGREGQDHRRPQPARGRVVADQGGRGARRLRRPSPPVLGRCRQRQR